MIGNEELHMDIAKEARKVVIVSATDTFWQKA